MPFATNAQFLVRYDNRRISEYLSDSGVPIDPGALSSNATLTALLNDASAEILMSARTGKRYTQAELEALATNSDPMKHGQIVSLCCALAWGRLVTRRAYPEQEMAMLAAPYREAVQTLERLRRGELIFDIDGVDNAGVEVAAGVGLNQESRDKLLTNQISRYFGCIVRPE